MKKFMLLYMSPVSSEEMMKSMTPEDSKKGMEMWEKWFKKVGSGAVDMGNPTAIGKNVSKSGTAVVKSPYVTGYSIIQAKEADEVEKWLDGHPHFMMDGNSVQVLEIMPMM